MPYSFRNRIRITLGQKRLESDEAIRTLDGADTGEVVTLQGFTTGDWLLLRGRGYETADGAFVAGRRWRQYLSVLFARTGISADFDPNPLPHRGPDDRPESPEAPGLIVYPDRGGLLLIEDNAEVYISRPLALLLSEDLPAVRESMPDGFESMPDVLKRRLELAYRLVHLALSNANPDVQFILWITAVEALIPDEKPKRKEAEGRVVEYLEDLREQVDADTEKFNRKVRKQVAGLLELAQEETITELGMTLARKLDKEYDGKSPDEFFQENYPVRSRLVHGNIDEQKRPEPREIQRRLPHLQQFVMDLLEVEAASADEGRQTER